MQRKDLALRVLSTAAIMSIVTSIAAPAFAGTYYLGDFKGSEFKVEVDTDGKVKVNDVEDTTEVVIRGGKEADYVAPAPATGNAEGSSAAGAATLELEAAGTAAAAGPAAGESQPDPDDAFTLSEEEEDSEEGKDPTDNPTDNPTENPTDKPTDNPADNPKKDVVHELAPADPEPEQQATKPTLSAAAAPAPKTPEATLSDAPAAAPTAATPTAGSVTTPTTSVIKIVNNWLKDVLNIRLDNVNIKSTTDAAMTVSGDGNTKIELDGKNTLDSSGALKKAGLNKQGNGTMTITDEKTDGGETRTSKAAEDETGSLTVVGGKNAAGIGGNDVSNSSKYGETTKNITIEGYATVDATSGQYTSNTILGGAGIGGGCGGNADNITIQGNANVTAKTNDSYGAAIGGGAYGSGTNIGIYDHATVKAAITGTGTGAAIGRGSYGQKASVTIGREGKTQENENVHVTAWSYDSAIGGMAGFLGTAADQTTKIVIQGGATIDEASCVYGPAIGGDCGVSDIIIRGHAVIKKAGLIGGSGYYGGGNKKGEKTTVSIEDHARLENVKAIGGQNVEEANVTVKDNAYVGAVGAIGDYNRIDYQEKIGKLTAKILGNATIENLSGWIGKRPYSTVGESEVTVDGGETGKVTVTASALGDKAYINAKTVQIKNNVLLKLKQSSNTDEPNYIAANGVEMTRDDLMKTIGDDAEIWYTDKDNKLQKIVHGKNVCKKVAGDLKEHRDATCGADGYNKYQCGYEKANHAENTSCDWKWQEVLKATGNHQHTEIRNKKDPTCTEKGYTGDTWCTDCNNKIATGTEIPALDHDWGDWQVTTPATCTTTGVKTRYCNRDHNHVDTQTIPALNHDYRDDWVETTRATCTTKGEKTRHCHNDPSHVERQEIPATGHQQTHIEGKKEPTCTEPGYTGDEVCDACGTVVKKGTVIPATGHHWKDNGDGTHTCPDCGATEGQPFNTNSALELRVVDAEGMNQPFTVSQNGTLRTYTGAYDTATLTGDLDTLRYLQEHGAQTIQFVTNGQTSSFVINDLLAQGSGSEVFYLTHRGAEEPTLLLVEADHSELVKD